jgi:hypothetical protein
MWGTVWEHDKGYRAEYARVASIDAIINGRDLERVTVGGSSYLENLRAQYGVALTSAND